MKVLIITGSPHKNGTSSLLVDEFIKGLSINNKEHHLIEIIRFDAAFKKIHPCIACNRCRMTDLGCIFEDDMIELNPHLLTADLIVFASPIYYFGISAQLKAVIDRFYAQGKKIHKLVKAALILTCADDTLESVEGPIATYKNTINYLGWKNIDIIVATNSDTVEDILKTDFPKQAYEFGKSIQ